MKPDDILNAIGDVDDKYVRRAHMKDRLKAFFAALATLVLLVFISGFLMEPDYVLTRISPDFEVNTEYVDPAHLSDDKWTTMVQTGYENGTEINQTVFARSLYGKYTITYTGLEGDEVVLVGAVQGDHYCSEYLDSVSDGNLYTETYYGTDLINRVDSIVIHGKSAYEQGSQLLNMLELEYTDEFLVRQVKRTDDQILGYRTLDYINKRLSKTTDYDSDGQMLRYTEYTYDEYTCTAITYNAESEAEGSVQSRYNWFGDLKAREHYDNAGNLVSSEVYHYRVWERYRGIEGMATLFVILCLAAAIGVGVYDDRIRIPVKRNGAPETEKDPDEVKSDASSALEKAKFAIRELELVLIKMDKDTRVQTITQLNGYVKRVNERLHETDDQTENESKPE